MLEREFMRFESVEYPALAAIALISPTRSGKLNPISPGLRAEVDGAPDRVDAGSLSRASSRSLSKGPSRGLLRALGVRG